MIKSVKFGLMAVAVAASTGAFAEDSENEYEAIGWTPIALGIASPVQIPWGSHQWDIFGLGVNAIWTDAPKMYGLGVGGLAMATRGDMMGVEAAGLCNWAMADVYGIRATLGANITFGTGYGLEAGLLAYRKGAMWGVDCEFLGGYQENFWGLEIGGLLNYNTVQSYGCTIAIGANLAKTAYGAQIAGVFNYTEELHGIQIGLINYAKECPWGLQLGLVNIIMDNKLKFLPIVNWYF